MNRKKLQKLDKYIIFSIAVIIIYSIWDMFQFMKTGSEPMQLTIGIFGFFGGEIVSSAIIKVFNIKNQQPDSNEPEIENEDGIEFYE